MPFCFSLKKKKGSEGQYGHLFVSAGDCDIRTPSEGSLAETVFRTIIRRNTSCSIVAQSGTLVSHKLALGMGKGSGMETYSPLSLSLGLTFPVVLV